MARGNSKQGARREIRVNGGQRAVADLVCDTFEVAGERRVRGLAVFRGTLQPVGLECRPLRFRALPVLRDTELLAQLGVDLVDSRNLLVYLARLRDDILAPCLVAIQEGVL